jgi:hypothetical protein
MQMKAIHVRLNPNYMKTAHQQNSSVVTTLTHSVCDIPRSYCSNNSSDTQQPSNSTLSRCANRTDTCCITLTKSPLICHHVELFTMISFLPKMVWAGPQNSPVHLLQSFPSRKSLLLMIGKDIMSKLARLFSRDTTHEE